MGKIEPLFFVIRKSEAETSKEKRVWEQKWAIQGQSPEGWHKKVCKIQGEEGEVRLPSWLQGRRGGLLLRVNEKFGSSRCGEWASYGSGGHTLVG